jgi:hypothetical protein
MDARPFRSAVQGSAAGTLGVELFALSHEERGGTHNDQGQHQGLPASDPVTEGSEDGRAHGPGQESCGKGLKVPVAFLPPERITGKGLY